ncbi:hypothetical protein [Streptomyces niveus]|uniref:hypothetical protein n=1 Tax=Streptomyces niveus TaxID=193462 RepID=UPI0033A97818
MSGEWVRVPPAEGWSTRFEEAEPVRGFRWDEGARGFAGWYYAVSAGDLIGFEPRLERDRLILLDRDPDVAGVASQPFWLH